MRTLLFFKFPKKKKMMKAQEKKEVHAST